ncbi:hypothetical protein NAEGRDRAFT_79441 [Naegleria gruberi]|uniref:Uncharacterized protein n=1 Tax=Naegleria gruberi TaxID=5762 RepID=D2VCK0_NAEGR|nr:uncharacterized protein NAEGRDRAFT_79441 [Naegleria gruberi]EFC45327.1 hypothetical protein NAEGRDRAFT_79441 [Naegleria gruberi]|eukprot:XP_002678071.1 hypothetical protein NAEGRDRAFT_79441 [Naegleria gruberi strain NEG-M]
MFLVMFIGILGSIIVFRTYNAYISAMRRPPKYINLGRPIRRYPQYQQYPQQSKGQFFNPSLSPQQQQQQQPGYYPQQAQPFGTPQQNPYNPYQSQYSQMQTQPAFNPQQQQQFIFSTPQSEQKLFYPPPPSNTRINFTPQSIPQRY